MIHYDRSRGPTREELADKIVKEKGSVLVPPFEDPYIIAGQGTTAYEATLQLQEQFCVRAASSSSSSSSSSYKEGVVTASASGDTEGSEVDAAAEATQTDTKPFFDLIVIPTSGGGLAAGCSIACKHMSPHTTVVCVEPEGFDDMQRSLASGVTETTTLKSGATNTQSFIQL